MASSSIHDIAINNNNSSINGNNQGHSVSPRRDASSAAATTTATTTHVYHYSTLLEPGASTAINSPQYSFVKTSTTTTENVENPIRLSKFSGGYEPDPHIPAKIERLDWPSPPYPPAVPELCSRSRSSSNRARLSALQDEEDDEDDLDQVPRGGGGASVSEVGSTRVSSVLNENVIADSQPLSSSSSLSLSQARQVKQPSRRVPATVRSSRYENKLFDNDYDDFLLKYRSDREFNELLDGKKKTIRSSRNTIVEHQAENDFVETHANEGENANAEHVKISSKLQREMQEIAKIEHESSMAAELLGEIRVNYSIRNSYFRTYRSFITNGSVCI